MSAKELLPFSSTAVQDVYYTAGRFDPSHSLFPYDGWTTVTNFAMRHRRLDPIGAPCQYGSLAIFRLDRSVFLRGPMQLHLRRTALTQPAGSTTDANYSCFVDFEGFATIGHVEVWHGQNMLQRTTGERLYKDYLKNKDFQEQKATDQLIFGNQPLGPGVNNGKNRIDRATTTQDMYIDLRTIWFTTNPRKYLMCNATSNEVEIRVFLRNLSEITQSTNNAYPTGASVVLGQLITLDIAVEQAEESWLLSQTEQATGINYKFNDVESMYDVPVQAGQQTYIVPMTNFKGACFSLDFALRINPRGNILTLNTTQSNQDLNGMPIRNKVSGGLHLRNNAWFGHNDAAFNALPIINLPQYVGMDVYRTVDFHSISTTDIIVWDRCSDAQSRYLYWPTFYRGTVGNSPLYSCILGMVPGDSHNCSGHKSWSAMINPVLRLEFVTAPTYDLLMDMDSNVYNNIQHHKNELFRTFQ